MLRDVYALSEARTLVEFHKLLRYPRGSDLTRKCLSGRLAASPRYVTQVIELMDAWEIRGTEQLLPFSSEVDDEDRLPQLEENLDQSAAWALADRFGIARPPDLRSKERLEWSGLLGYPDPRIAVAADEANPPVRAQDPVDDLPDPQEDGAPDSTEPPESGNGGRIRRALALTAVLALLSVVGIEIQRARSSGPETPTTESATLGDQIGERPHRGLGALPSATRASSGAKSAKKDKRESSTRTSKDSTPSRRSSKRDGGRSGQAGSPRPAATPAPSPPVSPTPRPPSTGLNGGAGGGSGSSPAEKGGPSGGDGGFTGQSDSPAR
jgi:hypothetical protein